MLLVQHGPRGSVGLVLNRPTQKRMGLGRGADGLALPAEVWPACLMPGRSTPLPLAPPPLLLVLLLLPPPPGLPRCLQTLRAPINTATAARRRSQGQDDGLFNSRVYWGGPEAEDALTLLHSNPRRRLKGSTEIPYGEVAGSGRWGGCRLAWLLRVFTAACHANGRPAAGVAEPCCAVS